MPTQLGYNTNGFAHHQLEDAITILAELGYTGVAITLDHNALNPFDPNSAAQAEKTRDLLKTHKMSCVVETGARFLLDPRRKHWPTLISNNADDRSRRIDFLKRTIDIAAILNAPIVSLWSGAKDTDTSDDEAMTRLIDGCCIVLDYAAARNIRLAFEPEPGMLIDTMDRFRQLHSAINHPAFGLTLDLGHIHCQRDGTPEDRIREFGDVLWNIHIEDMRRDVHDHLPIGEGDMNFPPIFKALKDIDYTGPVNVELSRHSHDAVETARNAMRALKTFL